MREWLASGVCVVSLITHPRCLGPSRSIVSRLTALPQRGMQQGCIMWTCIHSPTALGSLSLMAGSCVESLNGVPSTCVGSIASNVGVVARTARRLAVRCVLHRSLATHPSSAWMARSTTTNGGDCELLQRVPTETMLRSYHDDVPRARCPCAWQELGGKNVNIDVYIRQQ